MVSGTVCDIIQSTELLVTPNTYNCTGPIGSGYTDPADGTGYFFDLEECLVFCLSDIHDFANSTSTLRVYPNASNGVIQLCLSVKNGSFSKIEVINSIGQLVYFNNVQNSSDYSENINLSNEPKGIYHIKVIYVDQVINKIIILQ